MDSETTTHLQKLMETVRFTAEDLEANRKGLITDAQVIKLEETAFDNAIRVLYPMGLFMGLEYIFLRQTLGLYFMPVGWCVIVPGVFLLIVLLHKIWRILKADMELRWAASINGQVIVFSPTRSHPFFRVGIQGMPKMRFNIPDKAAREIKRRIPYCIYYSEHSHTLLSIEPLEPESENKESGFSTALHRS